MSVNSHIHISRKHHAAKNRGIVKKVTRKYLDKWQSLAENPLTFPIAVLFYPATVLTGTIMLITNGTAKKY